MYRVLRFVSRNAEPFRYALQAPLLEYNVLVLYDRGVSVVQYRVKKLCAVVGGPSRAKFIHLPPRYIITLEALKKEDLFSKKQKPLNNESPF